MSMAGLDPLQTISANYRAFALAEVAQVCPPYEALAYVVADDMAVLDFLASLPTPKRQPNLLFAAARHVLNDVPNIDTLRALINERPDDLAQVMRIRRTQTNEVGRCATLVPALAALPQPLAIIEVGASAGLNLLLDHYAYDYGTGVIRGPQTADLVLRCDARGPVPIPQLVPTITWRAGLDLNPLDVTDPDDVSWLHCLVWPGQHQRDERLAAALALAQSSRPLVRQGDLLSDLPALVAEAPRDATVVVFHSAVLAYVDSEARRRFAATVASLDVHWLSNEGPGVLPDVEVPGADQYGFVLVADGTTTLARTHPHGDWLEWLA